MASDPNLVGINIADRYCITGKIGSGGMGQVYSAISFEDPSRTVAIKLIQRDKELSSEDLLRFQKEAALIYGKIMRLKKNLELNTRKWIQFYIA